MFAPLPTEIKPTREFIAVRFVISMPFPLQVEADQLAVEEQRDAGEIHVEQTEVGHPSLFAPLQYFFGLFFDGIEDHDFS